MSEKEEIIKRNYALSREVDRYRRALEAGSRRYKREQQRARQEQERTLQQASHRVELAELAGQEQALLQLQASMASHEAHKIMHQARLRADKLAAKLVRRGGELGKERAAWVGHIASRERALEDAGKRTAGLKASLREAKLWGAGMEAEMNRAIRDRIQALDTIRDLRQKLRDANSSVIMEALGGGLEIRPLSGRQHEDTTGYGPAALRAAKGIQ